MSNSQEQSLDEDAVFLPVDESSPQFLHCEKERQAVERLLSAGPESFYTSIDAESSGCFLSPEEVSQITRWAQDYRINHLRGQRDGNGVEGSSEMEDFCSTYFPCHTDTPAPSLELGWPEKLPCVPVGSVTVHTSPPAEGEPPVREIIRWHLQKASQVIAVVTDRLTDGPIIADLHKAASRGVPIYIILNQSSIQENFMLNRLMHPNMRVRVLGGRTFCSRTGRMVVGEMKNKFLLVDLETVIHGSYSLTWTDAHLHRQLITVLHGPVVDSFDREFRILFAASLPFPETRRVADTHLEMTHKLRDFSDLQLKKQLSLESEVTNPPSPPADSFLDWEAMGVVQRHTSFPPLSEHEEIVPKEMALQNNMLLDKNTHVMDTFTNNGNQFLDMKRECENRSPMTNALDESTFNNTLPSPSDSTTSEGMKRVERRIEKTLTRQVPLERSDNLDDRTTMSCDAKKTEPTQRRATSKREPILEEESNMDTTSSAEDKPSSKKPIILRVPQSANHSSLSDIMRRVKTRLSTSGLFNRGPNASLSEMSQSMMDLSAVNTDTNPGIPVPKFKANRFGPGHMTPAYALMKNRNDDMKSMLHRTPKTFLIRERPRSSSFALSNDWRTSLKERGGEQE